MSLSEPSFYPVFLKLTDRRVLVVGAGPVAASKLEGLLAAGARITVVAPDMVPAIEALAAPGAPGAAQLTLERRPFAVSDLDAVFYVVAAATPDVNRAVADACEARQLFVNAVDDPPNASANLGGVVRRDGVTLAISTDGKAPALAGLLREGLDALLPADLDRWLDVAQEARVRWKAEAVPMEARRPQLLEALVGLYSQRQQTLEAAAAATSTLIDATATDATTVDAAAAEAALDAVASEPAEPGAWRLETRRSGFVSLVGAGPGDPDLLTQLAARRLAEADLVLYDALVSPDVLPLAAHAQKLSVGKRACRPSISQDTINRVLVRAAKRGRRVVRLKCGDPFVFGRGGEEALALAGAGVPFEVVPGVSSALAAPGLAGIPVTHRGITSSFTVLSGHSESAYAPVLDSLSPGASTLVVLMGIGTRAALAERLMARGWPAHTPAAILLSASTPDAQTWTGTLDALATRADGVHAQPGETPGMLVIGGVVALAGQLGLARNLLNEYVTESGEVAHGSGG
jgi:uroporphyrin-III C-methyltransferase/precorrin-2 dehydrogenase/sirohydrochlorin ferrochelatase